MSDKNNKHEFYVIAKLITDDEGIKNFEKDHDVAHSPISLVTAELQGANSPYVTVEEIYMDKSLMKLRDMLNSVNFKIRGQ